MYEYEMRDWELAVQEGQYKTYHAVWELKHMEEIKWERVLVGTYDKPGEKDGRGFHGWHIQDHVKEWSSGSIGVDQDN